MVVVAVAWCGYEAKRLRLVNDVRAGGQGIGTAPHDAAVGTYRPRIEQALSGSDCEREWNTAFGEERRIPSVVFVIMRDYRGSHVPLVQIAGEGGPRARKSTVDENPIDEICAHIHSRDAAAPTRKAYALHVVEALNLDHATR